ncbi:MAG: polyketide cyclase [Thermoleophilaceae bacterium]|nr:polyketide cyclase [Thermoleophilaceae bacterium]
MSQYRFLTTWLLEASRGSAWEVLQDPLRWPEWWRGVERVSEVAAGDDRRLGSRYRIAWRSRIPYELQFDFTVRHVEAPRVMEGDATGELEGTGRWRLFEENGVTAVVYDWRVRSTKRWMNLLAPLARPVFEYNHDVVMRWGGEGLARRLGTELLAAG